MVNPAFSRLLLPAIRSPRQSPSPSAPRFTPPRSCATRPVIAVAAVIPTLGLAGLTGLAGLLIGAARIRLRRNRARNGC